MKQKTKISCWVKFLLSKILSINKYIVHFIAKVGDIFKLPLNSERLTKLTESYNVSNLKIKSAIGKDLPLSTEQGLLKTFESFVK